MAVEPPLRTRQPTRRGCELSRGVHNESQWNTVKQAMAASSATGSGHVEGPASRAACQPSATEAATVKGLPAPAVLHRSRCQGGHGRRGCDQNIPGRKRTVRVPRLGGLLVAQRARLPCGSGHLPMNCHDKMPSHRAEENCNCPTHARGLPAAELPRAPPLKAETGRIAEATNEPTTTVHRPENTRVGVLLAHSGSTFWPF
jgi:hypothetical protein